MAMQKLSGDVFDSSVAHGVSLVEFQAEWCGPCKTMAEAMEREVAPALDGSGAGLYSVDVDASPELAARFGVFSIPTLLVMSGGIEVERMTGVQPAQKVVDAVLSRIG